MMADMLKADALEYPAQWIEEAVSEAVERTSALALRARDFEDSEGKRDVKNDQNKLKDTLKKYRRLYQEQRRGRKGD